MKTALICSILITIGIFLFMDFLYIVFSIITTLINNMKKDEFHWYAFSLTATYARTEQFESFGEMVKFGVVSNLKLSAVSFFIVLAVCLYVIYS